ncbi:L-serine ammonia-lyase, iron-sulfur-dependent, subunit alpha [Lachnospiraceae bacterium NSJ-143]|nr:L-serine ammonia-lyase, iron-sulfur-dependent, subunit alpha [Lachnospiraceae bacterium NSJ-143]
MAEKNVSIFNDVLGPVITGPSSSNTAGALRVTRMMRALMPDFKKAVIYVDDIPGAFAPALQGLKSGVAFAAGLLDFEVNDLRIADARKIAKEMGLSIRFEIKHFKDFGYAELVETVMENSVGEVISAVGASIGGGMAKLLEVNGIPVDIRGSAYEIMIYSKTRICEKLKRAVYDRISSKTVIIEDKFISDKNGEIYEIKVEKKISKELENELKIAAENAGNKLFVFDAILTVSEKKQEARLPFTTTAELDKYLADTGKTMFEAAVDYETNRSGWSEKEVFDYAQYLVKSMKISVEEGLEGDYKMSGYSIPYSGKIRDTYNNTKKLIPLGVADKAAYYAMAVMELNSGMGRIVTCPTAGSSGIMPGILLAMIEDCGISLEKATEGFLVGGLIGMFVAALANFDGSDGACQAEVASGCAMGAAAACYIMGGTTKQIENAAVLCFEALMGLICDPIAVYPEVPCILRNPMGCSVAFTMTNLALCDYNPFVPLDEIIVAMRDVGAQMPPYLRCQCSGTCATPTAQKIKENMEKINVFNFNE